MGSIAELDRLNCDNSDSIQCMHIKDYKYLSLNFEKLNDNSANDSPLIKQSKYEKMIIFIKNTQIRAHFNKGKEKDIQNFSSSNKLIYGSSLHMNNKNEGFETKESKKKIMNEVKRYDT